MAADHQAHGTGTTTSPATGKQPLTRMAPCMHKDHTRGSRREEEPEESHQNKQRQK
ncbi:Hypothetical predicted protein [Pelobates cultripes]|uniref:Uncharacterized protein n=1 Tax=Pelobates cultripes TaxID=61616 RepID=A0AAD1TG54_PELCU|nr:Hypothetical predicted protein [Pelobates cultripes]